MDDWAELDRALGEFVRSGAVEVHEDGQWLAGLADLQYEMRRAGKEPLVHLWSDEKNLTRRVKRLKEQTADRIVLEVHRLGRSKPGRLEFLRTDSPRPAGRITREQFRARFDRMLAEAFPDGHSESLSAAPDLEHSFSGMYVRGRMHEGASDWAFLAASPSENGTAIDGMLAFGLLWLDWTRGHSEKRAVEGLRLFVPEGGSRILRERVLALSPIARTEIYEFSEPDSQMKKIDPADAGNLDSSLISRRDVESTLAAARDWLARIRAMIPGTADAIETRVPSKTSELVFSFRGLEFARWTREGLLFGIGEATEKLTTTKIPALESDLRQLDLHRNSLAADTKNYFYRAAPERWLETLVLEDPSRLDAQLDPKFLYSQVPALSGGDRGVLDLLGVTRPVGDNRIESFGRYSDADSGRGLLAASAPPSARGRLSAFRIFQRNRSGSEAPLVWLVAPGLRFHSATEILLKYLSPEIQISRIGVNENWRRGIKIVFRQ